MKGPYLIVFQFRNKEIQNYIYTNESELEIDICDIRRTIRDIFDTYEMINILNIIKLSR